MPDARYLILFVFLMSLGPFAAVAQEDTASFADRFDAAQELKDTAPEEALALHTALTEEGYERSYVQVASLLMDLGRVGEARAAYVSAVEAGNDYARVKLAEGDAKGRFGAASDPVSGVAMLKELAEDPENERAIYTLADLYFKGDVVERDPVEAHRLFTPLAENGSVWALSRIGALELSGDLGAVDADAAADAYGRAVALGHDRALLGLTEALMAAGRYEEALVTVDDAIAKDARGARLKKARWHLDRAFGPFSDPEAGAREVAALVDQGDTEAARFVSYKYVETPRLYAALDVNAMFETLRRAGSEGDAKSTKAAARAYRKLDGRMRGARAAHASLIEEQAALLDDRTRVIEEVYAAYDFNAHRRSREKTADIVSGYTGEAFAAGMMELRGIERTAFVYALQRELAEAGLYTGRQHGRLTQRTIRAIMTFCRERGIADECRHGPIRKETSQAIVEAMGNWKGERQGGT